MVTKLKIRKSKRKNKSNRKVAKLLNKKKTVKKMRGGALTPAAAKFMASFGPEIGTSRMQSGVDSTKQAEVQELLKKFQQGDQGPSKLSPAAQKFALGLVTRYGATAMNIAKNKFGANTNSFIKQQLPGSLKLAGFSGDASSKITSSLGSLGSGVPKLASGFSPPSKIPSMSSFSFKSGKKTF